MILAWASLGLAAVPAALASVNLALYRTPPRVIGACALSVLIPARNEAANIADAVGCVLASDGVSVDLVVLDDGSTDATASILAGIGDPRLRVITGSTLPPGWSGKQHACARLADHAAQETLVFIDADVRLAPDALARMAGFMQRNEVGLASGFPREIVVGWSEILLLPLIHFLLLGFLPMPLMRRFASPSLGAGCGQIMIARADAYRRAGGHTAISTSLHDGLTLPRAFRRAGIMTGLFDASHFADCRMYHSARDVWDGLGKNATEGMATPVALPIWTVILGLGQVAPAVLWLAGGGAPAALALLCGLLVRLMLAMRFRQPVVSAVLHPAGVLGVLAVQWAALLRSARGRPATWRGRVYPARL